MAGNSNAANGCPGIDAYFDSLPQLGASDLHMKVGVPLMVRIAGGLRALDMPPVTPQQAEGIAMSLLNDEQRAELLRTGGVDLAYATPSGCRVRINIFRQRGTFSMAARYVNATIPTFEELLLPAATLRKVAAYDAGLVLLAGATGSGKSTTLAAMIDHINHTRKCHVLTLEDPIEYVFQDDKAVINQREIGIDVDTFKNALRYAMREDPDVILMGEMRDEDTVQTGITAAETGHLVLGTIHSGTAPQVISRLLDLFPGDRQTQVRKSLVFNLRAVICQKLLRCTKKTRRRVPACEVMIVNAAIRKLIDEGDDEKIVEVMRGSREAGMIDFTHGIYELVQQQLVTKQEALANAPNPDALQSMFDGLDIK